MPILNLEKLTHVEFSGLNRSKTVVFVPVGPIEEHAPHLPLGVDAMTSEFFSVKMIERLEKNFSDWNFILFPTFFIGSDTLTYAGSFEVRPKVLRAVLYDSCRQLAKDGFKNIVTVGAHGGPRHMVVLEELASRMKWQHKARMISASSKIIMGVLEGKFVDKISDKLEKMGDKLSAEERAGLAFDYHAGLLETSIMLYAKPELVKPGYKELPPVIIDKVWKIRRSSAKKTGAGHLGTPSLARKEIGHAATEVFMDTLEPLMIRFLNGEKVDKEFRSKLYYIPFFRTDFVLAVLIIAYAIVLGVLVLFLNSVVLEISK